MLHLSTSSTGNATISGSPDSINYSNNMKFSTTDADHDNNPDGNCAAVADYGRGYNLKTEHRKQKRNSVFDFSGWWYDYCTDTALNGKYDLGSDEWQDEYGFYWWDGDKIYINPTQSRMMLRKIAS
jgi:hypothetical protein